MSLTWYLVPRRANADSGEWEPDTSCSSFYALAVGTDYYLLTGEVLADPTLTNPQVVAAGLVPARTVEGA